MAAGGFSTSPYWELYETNCCSKDTELVVVPVEVVCGAIALALKPSEG